MPPPAPQRAAPPRPPTPSRHTRALLAQAEDRIAAQTTREHFSLLRGLLWITLLILAIGLFRAGLHRAFIPGWLRQW